jgi:hypothetical protein
MNPVASVEQRTSVFVIGSNKTKMTDMKNPNKNKFEEQVDRISRTAVIRTLIIAAVAVSVLVGAAYFILN